MGMAEFDQLVGTVQPVTAEDLECLHNPSPAFREWVWDAFLTGRLDVFVTAALRTGAASDIPTALRHLAEVSDSLPSAAPRIVVADLERKVPRGYRLRELRSLLAGESVGNNASIALRHGSIGHEAIQALLTDQLLTPKRSVPLSQHVAQQLSLFANADDSTPLTLFPKTVQRGREQSFRLLRTIDRLWHELAATMEIGATNLLGESDLTGWQRKRATAARLRRSLALLFGSYAKKLETSSGDARTAIHMLSLMSWASAVSFYRHARTVRGRVLFRELPVLASAQELGGGRIDALEVRTINGVPPTGREQRVLAQLAQSRQFHSSGELLRLLVEQFRSPLEIAIIDWKFLVGDVFVAGHDWRYPNLEAAPLLEHERQIRRYLTLIPVDYHLADQRSEDVWHPRGITLTGLLVYFVPHRLPILHEVTMTPDETEARFIREVVHKWGSASRRSSIRQLYNGLVGHLVQKLSGAKRQHQNGTHAKNGANGVHDQGELFEVIRTRTARTVVERHRQKATIIIAGTDGILERLNGDDGACTLRYDRLLAMIEAGKVTTAPGFDPNGGGKIGCVFPGHRDSTPSMQIYLSGGRPRFWCFGCCSGGMIALDSIPIEAIQMHGDSWRRTESGRRQWEHRQHHRLELEVDDYHHRIMATAQGILAQAFARSPGVHYLRTARRLDPDLAATYGAGYGTIEFLSQMIDAGFSFDALAHYGFLAFSPSVDDRSWAVRLFERHGIPRAQQYRDVRVKGRGKVPGQPYFTLSRRVTFPLSLFGRVNNVYGRAIFTGSKHQAHRKLKVEGSRTKHGGFNMQVLEPDSGHAEVIVLEGVMDALTLVQIGRPNTLAMIGVQNAAILTAVVQSGKAVATGLDLDATGRKQTTTIAELLSELGHRNAVRDFTTEFFGSETRFKDFNEWLKAGSPQLNS